MKRVATKSNVPARTDGSSTVSRPSTPDQVPSLVAPRWWYPGWGTGGPDSSPLGVAPEPSRMGSTPKAIATRIRLRSLTTATTVQAKPSDALSPARLVAMARGFPYPDLKDFLAALERAGELRRVAVPVDPTLEISEIVTRTVRAGGPALLFEKPTRGEMPVAINLFGTHRRMAMALGVDDVEEIGDRIGALIRPELPVGWAGIRDGLGKLMQLKSVPPKHVRSAPCQERVYDSVDLDRLPGLQTWPGDGGVFHNFGLTHTRHPETGKRNLGLYRLHQHSRDTLGMHWQIHKD